MDSVLEGALSVTEKKQSDILGVRVKYKYASSFGLTKLVLMACFIIIVMLLWIRGRNNVSDPVIRRLTIDPN